MGVLADVWRRLRSLVRRTELEDRLDDEIRFHVEQQIEKNRRAGMTPDEARRQALIRFGGVEQMRERTRDEFRAARIEHLVRDVRYGLRSLRRHPAFSVMAVLSLAIGIGANAAIFGVVHAVLFRDSPLVQPETLVNIYETEGGQRVRSAVAPEHRGPAQGHDRCLQRHRGVDVRLRAARSATATAEMVMGEAMTGGAFALLGVQPLLGRAILPEDDIARGGHPVVMLGYGYWQRAFGADPQVVGRTLRMGGRAYTIIGVAPANYYGGTAAPHAGLLRPDGDGERADGCRHARPARLPQLLRQGAARTGRDASAGRAHRLCRRGESHSRAAGRVDPGTAVLSRADRRRADRSRSGSAAACGGLAARGPWWGWCCCWRVRTSRVFFWRGPSIGGRRWRYDGPSARLEARSSASCSSRARCSALAARQWASSWRSGFSVPCCRSISRCPSASSSIFISVSTRRRCSIGVSWRSRRARASWQGDSSDSSLPCRERAPISARRSRPAAEEAMRPALSGGATRWSSLKSRCRSCCSWAPGCS